MKARIFTLLCLSAFVVSTTQAQRITSFALDNVTSLGHSAAFNPKNDKQESPGDLQIIYPADADLSNSNAVMEGSFTVVTDPMPTDWSTVQNIQLSSTSYDEDSVAVVTNAWYNITCKKINPAPLPFTINMSEENLAESWTSETQGWAAACIQRKQKNVRFGNDKANFIVAFTDTPDSLYYNFNVASATCGENLHIDVEESADGIEWSTIITYTAENIPLSSATPAEKAQAFKLQSSTRYVRWYYAFRDGDNVSFTDDLTITKGEASDGIANASQTVEVKLSPVPAVDVLNIAAQEAIANVTICNIAGQNVASYANVGTQISVSTLAAGSYLAIVTLEDGSKAVKSFIKK